MHTPEISWKKSPHALSLRWNGRLLWTWVADPTQGKPYFHPLNTAGGTCLSDLRPADHPWHRGLWWSWKFLNGINFWEEDPETGESEGLTILENASSETLESGAAIIDAVLRYQTREGQDLLRENRRITVSPPDGEGAYHMIWELAFRAETDTECNRTPLPDEGGPWFGGYAGFSLRRSHATDTWAYLDDTGRQGHEKIHGQRARWVSCQSNTPEDGGSVTIFDHPGNPGHPSHWYAASGDLPYFSPALIFRAPITLKKGDDLRLRYRIDIDPFAISSRDLDARWQSFSQAGFIS